MLFLPSVSVDDVKWVFFHTNIDVVR